MSPNLQFRTVETTESVTNREDPMVEQLFWLAQEVVHRLKPASPMKLGERAWEGFWAEFRAVTRQMLEAAVLDDVRMAKYEAWVRTLPQHRVDASERSFPEVEQDRVVKEGLDFLGTDYLVRLALAPKALAAITARVREGEAEAWEAALERLVERDIETGVVAVPKSGPFFDMGKALYEKTRTPAASALAERVTMEGRLFPLSPHQLYGLFEERRRLEADAVDRLFKLERLDRLAVANNLQRNVDEARLVGDPSRFAALDVAFHVILGGAAAGCPVMANEAIRFVADYGDRVALASPGRRELVCDEHQAIVTALSEDDSDAALGAVVAHLQLARSRWLPGHKGYIARKNMGYFDCMTGGLPGDLMCVASLDISPVEMLSNNWASEGRAAAAAVRRGATLVYLRPTQRMLNYWSSKELMDAAPTLERATADEFVRFRGDVAEELKATQAYETLEEAEAVVARQVLLFPVSFQPLFFLVRSSGVLGYFRYCNGEERMTYREPSAEDASWPEIVGGATTDPTRQTFVVLAARALAAFARGEPDGEARHSAESISLRLLEGVTLLRRAKERCSM